MKSEMAALLAWHRNARRDLPWRRPPRTPYRVLVAEAMLQQTRAEAAAPRYEAFLHRFPDFATLAAAPLDEVLRSWEGLGYYARARNLWRLAQVIGSEGGALPSGREALISLPGVGEYIASAVRTFAFGIPDPALDANIRRIALRLLGVPGDPLTSEATRAARDVVFAWLRQVADPALLTDGLMDLGATVCTARRPRCGECPLRPYCVAADSGEPEGFAVRPRRSPKPVLRITVACLRSPRGQAWRPRPTQGLLGGLWEPPHVLESDLQPQEALSRELRRWGARGVRFSGRTWPMRHVFTHQVWEGEVLEAFAAALPLTPPARWLDERALGLVAVPSAFHPALAREG